MPRAFLLLITFFLTGGVVWSTAAQTGDARQASDGELKPPLPGALPVAVKNRLPAVYSARSKFNDRNPLDGIGVVDNWSKDIGAKPWGEKGTLSLVAFPNEAVAYGKYRGIALRIINRTQAAAAFTGCDSLLYVVQEALDEKGRWREIEDPPSSWCGNSYHQVYLEAGRYWEFKAPQYSGPIKTKIRFRLDREDGKAIYSKEFNGSVAKEQIRKGPSTREIARALYCKNLQEEGVMETLIALVREEAEKDERGRSTRLPQEAADHLAIFGAAAREAVPALRTALQEKTGKLRASAAYALWRIDGQLDDCLKTLLGMLDDRKEAGYHGHVAGLLYQMGPVAKAAVPSLCQALNQGNEDFQDMAISALGAIRARADIAVPALVKALNYKSTWGPLRAVEALAEFGAEARPAIPHLIAALKDESHQIKRAAAIALWRIEGNAKRVLPVLMEQLKLPNRNGADEAAEWLGEIGLAAKAAIPELTRNLKSKDDPPLRIRAAGALWRITKQAEPSLSVLSKEFLSTERLYHADVAYALRILQEMGGQAKAALPALRAALRAKQSDDVRALLEKGLRNIEQ